MRTRIFLIILMLMLVQGRFAQVTASPVTVNGHFFAKSLVLLPGEEVPWRLANVSSIFTQDDEYSYAYTNASFSSANFTWRWYDPSGAFYRSFSEIRKCQIRFCEFYAFIHLAGSSSALRLGRWRMDLLADDVLLYSDYFTLLPVIDEEDNWYFNLYANQPQYEPPRAHVNLTVVIHPHNLTWSDYGVRMPYAANITAYDLGTNRPLQVIAQNDSSVIVEFGAPRGDGYKFMLSFDLAFGFTSRSELSSNRYHRDFNLTWYQSIGVHPVPQKFIVALPSGSTLVRVIAPTNYTTGTIRSENRSAISFNFTAPPDQALRWSIVFYNETILPTPQATGAGTYSSVLALEVPILPLTLRDVSTWAGIVSLILLTTSELLSPRYGRTVMVINRRRLRAVALVIAIIFLSSIAFVIYKIVI